jgi:N-acetyl-gamma-glutamyl-phosphate reductase
MAQAQELLAAGVKVIDLAADFRIKDVAQFEKWYGIPHTCLMCWKKPCTACRN